MLTIQMVGLKKVDSDAFTATPAGESATLVCTGGEIHPELASLMPYRTQIIQLVRTGDRSIYHVTTRGAFSVAQFVTIAAMFGAEQFKEAYDLISRLKPEYDYER